MQPPPKDGARNALFSNLSKSGLENYVVKRFKRHLLRRFRDPDYRTLFSRLKTEKFQSVFECNGLQNVWLNVKSAFSKAIKPRNVTFFAKKNF